MSDSARQQAQTPPTDLVVSLSIMYFYADATEIDIDNIIKPIADALIGVAYHDDSQISDVWAAKRSLDVEFTLSEAAPELVSAISNGGDFVHIVVAGAPDHRILR